MATSFSDLSVSLTRAIPKDVKKGGGIFFTPPGTIQKALLCLPHVPDHARVLEPSCGSCEFVKAVSAHLPLATITAVENNQTIYDGVKHLATDRISVLHRDFLEWEAPQKYHLIVGNPPYFVMKKTEVEPSYFQYFEGRPNIFVLFVMKCLGLLEPRGVLCFVLPTSFLNSQYYRKARDHIRTQCTIVNILECAEDYLETKQDTIVLTLRNCPGDNADFVYGDAFCKPQDVLRLRELSAGTTTLGALGFDVYVGKVVWNQHKDILTDDPSKTLLIYSSDIRDRKLVIQLYTNPAKKNYIDKPGRRGKLLVLNRGYGVGTYKFDYCLIDSPKEYLVENHLICVEGKEDLYPRIMKSLDDERTAQFIQLYFGNSAMSTNEIKNVLPIWN